MDYIGPEVSKRTLDYLRDTAWVAGWKAVVKGVNISPINDILMKKADNIALALEPRLDFHVAERVDRTKHSRWKM